MPKVAFLCHGDPLSPHGLTFKSCSRMLNLAEVIAWEIIGIRLIFSAEEHEAKETARLFAEMFRVNVETHPGLSNDGDKRMIEAFIRSLRAEKDPVIVVTHRRIMGRLLKETVRQAGRPFIFTDKRSRRGTPALRRKLLEFAPRAIIIDTATMEARIVSVKKHAV